MGSASASSPAVAGWSRRISSMVRLLSSPIAFSTASMPAMYPICYVPVKVHTVRGLGPFGWFSLAHAVAIIAVAIRPRADEVPRLRRALAFDLDRPASTADELVLQQLVCRAGDLD